MMVFDDWNNGVLVAYILTSKCAQEDLKPWMRALNALLLREKVDGRPNAFVVDCAQGEINNLQYVFPSTCLNIIQFHFVTLHFTYLCGTIQLTMDVLLNVERYGLRRPYFYTFGTLEGHGKSKVVRESMTTSFVRMY